MARRDGTFFVLECPNGQKSNKSFSNSTNTNICNICLDLYYFSRKRLPFRLSIAKTPLSWSFQLSSFNSQLFISFSPETNIHTARHPFSGKALQPPCARRHAAFPLHTDQSRTASTGSRANRRQYRNCR